MDLFMCLGICPVRRSDTPTFSPVKQININDLGIERKCVSP